ncbi:MAG: HAD-IIIA family hydrolase [Candidatus Eisenbacteria bacterium]|nr:HAD-IIIA family hydrolase [Candidatus Eisenbacteria bacterium]
MERGGRAVFLDRDGTITVERGHITRPSDLELIDGAAKAIRNLNSAGYLAVLVSNQSGVARGLMSEEDLAGIHAALEELLSAEGALLDAAYYCPNYEGGSVPGFIEDTSCRKPDTGMIEAARRDLGMDIASSFVVGDQITDIELARNAGMPGVLVMTGKGARAEARARERGVAIARKARDLREAVAWILSLEKGGR